MPRTTADHQIPGGIQDARWPELLPGLEVEAPAAGLPADQTAHDDALRHINTDYRIAGRSIAGLLPKNPTGMSLKPAW